MKEKIQTKYACKNIERIYPKRNWFADPHVKWLTEKEAKFANEKRGALLRSIFHKVKHNFMGYKIATGDLSPGCLICGQGDWLCLYTKSKCTARCFFCPQDGKRKEEPHLYYDMRIKFDTPQVTIDYLDRFKMRGISFSGGEPFVALGEILKHIKRIKKRFGKDMYIWIYTNGDLVNKDKLMRLKEAGLNEIRFNISSRNYDLRPAELAVNIIDTVTVEIPAIPEDYEIVKKCLVKMQDIGVKHLNLHGLQASPFNYNNFLKRGYTFLHLPNYPIFESELCALELIKYAVDNKITLPINYCSNTYKFNFQGRGNRMKLVHFVKENFEEVTDLGYIRRLSAEGRQADIKKLVEILKADKRNNNLWKLSNNETKIFMHWALIKYLDFNKFKLNILYFEPRFMADLEINNADSNNKVIDLNYKKKLRIEKIPVTQLNKMSRIAIEIFHNLFIEKFIEKIGDKKFVDCLSKKYKLNTRQKWNKAKEEIKFFVSLENIEYFKPSFSEVY
jgi:pyruvate formate-lyase activating enzyme-like uncharacterized protein